MISCRDALERITEFMDGELEGLSAAEVEEHFRVCGECYPHLQLEESFRERVRRALARPEIPTDLRSRVLALLAEEDAAPEGDPAPAERRGTPADPEGRG